VSEDARGDAVMFYDTNMCGLSFPFTANWLTVEYYFAVINKGQVMTQYYRFMNKNGGYTWVQTCATVVCNSKNAEEQNVICVNYVIRYVISYHFQLCSVLKVISCLIDLDVCTSQAPNIVTLIFGSEQWQLVARSYGRTWARIIIWLMRRFDRALFQQSHSTTYD
jgi:hypothetical protein